MTYRLTLRGLLLAVAALSCLFACLFVPGRIYVHLPLMFMGVLALFSARAAAHLWRGHSRRAELHRNRLQLFGSGVLMALIAGVYFPFFGVAVRKMKDSQFAASQMEVLLNLRDPIATRDAARMLHQQVVKLPPEDRTMINGTSDILPKEITDLHPQYVTVTDDCIGLIMCYTTTDWFGLVIYPEGCPEVGGDRRLAEGIWYWETP